MEKQGIKVVNFKQVMTHFENLDLYNKQNALKIRKVVREPFNRFRDGAHANLMSQRSTKTWNLARGLAVRSRLNKNKGHISVAFGGISSKINNGKKKGAINHFHLVNSGTRSRWKKSNGQFTGAVGKRKTKRDNMNVAFKVGFADRAIRGNLHGIGALYASKFNEIFNNVKTTGV